MKLEGSLAESDFADLLQVLHERRWTGVLTLTHRGVGRSVTVKEGRLVFASSTDPDDRLGEQLLRAGKITARALADAAAAVTAGKRMGAVLVERGLLGPKDLVKAVTDQAEQILYGLFQWSEGRYRLQPGPIPSESITLKISTPDVIMEGIHRVEAWSRIERGVGRLESAYVRAEDYEQVLAQMSLSFEKLSLLTDLTGTRDVETICAGSSLPDFEVCRALWAFRVIGVVRRVDARRPGETPVVEEGPPALAAPPAIPPSAVERPPAEPREAAPAEPAAEGPARKTILVVGVEPEVFDKVDPLLSRSLFAVERSGDPKAALALCAGRSFDLVLLRHPVPGMDLGDVLRPLRQESSPCARSQLVVLTEEGRLAEAREQGGPGLDLALALTEPARLLEEVATRLLGVAPRRSARILIRLEVRLDEGKRLVMYQSENLSEAGVLLRTDRLYPIGTRARFEFQPPGEKAPVQGEAEVVRHAAAEVENVRGVGLRFLRFRADGLQKLRAFLGRAASR